MTAPAEAPVIRPLLADEWPELRDVRIQALEDSPDAFSFTAAEARQQHDSYWQRWAAGSPDGRRSVFIVEHHGKLQGLGSAVLSDDRIGHVGAMWLAPSLRGTGLGGQLFDAVRGFLLQLDPVAVVLTVTETNAPAISLYRSRGFEFTGVATPLRPGSPLQNLEMKQDLLPQD
ncbi:MAG: N-acetyltransferase family protein [Dehalococcoidia bacterium]